MSQEFTLLCFINKTQDNNTNQLILTLLRKCITLFNIYYKINCSFSETNKDYIFYIPAEIDPNKENQKRKELQKLFSSYFSQEHTFLMNYYKLRSSLFKPFPLPTINFKWKSNIIRDTEQRLPELKGIFEAVELNPHFSLTNEEKNAITELSETIQNIIQKHEQMIQRMMEVLKTQTLHLQNKKLDKYIGIVHLREDLRIAIGKICDKHFSPLNIISLPYWYQRVFDKAVKGVGEKVRDGGITFVNEDDVLEVVFDTYQYFLGERIIPSKRIETSEIKDFLTKFFPLSLNATITKHPFAFSSEYLELRKEKTKFNIVNQRLPELEGIF